MLRYLGYAVIRIGEEFGAFCKPDVHEILKRRHVEQPLENPAAFAVADVRGTGDIAQRDLFCVVVVYKAAEGLYSLFFGKGGVFRLILISMAVFVDEQPDLKQDYLHFQLIAHIGAAIDLRKIVNESAGLIGQSIAVQGDGVGRCRGGERDGIALAEAAAKLGGVKLDAEIRAARVLNLLMGHVYAVAVEKDPLTLFEQILTVAREKAHPAGSDDRKLRLAVPMHHVEITLGVGTVVIDRSGDIAECKLAGRRAAPVNNCVGFHGATSAKTAKAERKISTLCAV